MLAPAGAPSDAEAERGDRTMAYRHTASFGKRQEFVAIAELLRRGFDVYMTLVDDQQIDCVIRQETRKGPVYQDIQIKAGSRYCAPTNFGRFAGMRIPDPRPGYFFIFYSEPAGAYCVMPSLDLVRLASQNRKGKNKGTYTIQLARWRRRTTEVRPRPKFDRYRDNFDLLRWGSRHGGSHEDHAHSVRRR